MRIYTRTGDLGTTGLIGGTRISKASLLIESIGSVDYLNACLGICRVHSKNSKVDPLLEKLQHYLFGLGAELATPVDAKNETRLIQQEDIDLLENSMDDYTAQLEPLHQFILPGGSSLGASLHYARVVSREAERTLFRLHEMKPLRKEVLMFMNRVSDWFFVAARIANSEVGVSDIAWDSSVL